MRYCAFSIFLDFLFPVESETLQRGVRAPSGLSDCLQEDHYSAIALLAALLHDTKLVVALHCLGNMGGNDETRYEEEIMTGDTMVRRP